MAAMSFPLMRLRSDDVPRQDRLSFVHDFVARHVGGMEFRPADSDNVMIDLEAVLLPGTLTVGRGIYTPMHGARTPYLLQDGRDHYLLTYHTEDHEISIDGKAPIKVAAGDVIVTSEAIASQFWLGKQTSVEVVSLDRRLLAALVPRIEREPSYVISRAASLPLFISYIKALRRSPPASLKAGEIASRHVYDLAALLFDGLVAGGAERNENSIAAARLKLIKKDILERLSNPSLHIDTVAQRQGITARYVQRLFEDDGTTFSDFVRERRLDLVLALLESPGRKSHTIASIAVDAGFSDIASFNRAFRNRFGTTPSQIRASTLIE